MLLMLKRVLTRVPLHRRRIGRISITMTMMTLKTILFVHCLIDAEKGIDSRTSSEEEEDWSDLYNDDNDDPEDNFVRPLPDTEDQTNPYGQLINQQPVYDLLLNRV